MLDQARVHGPDELARLGKRIFEVIDPELADRREGELLEAAERRALESSRLTMRKRGDGTTQGSFRLPDLQADMLRTALEALSSPRRHHPTTDRHALAGLRRHLLPPRDHDGSES